MSADLTHVPTEGMQRTVQRLLLEAAERYQHRRADFAAHDATFHESVRCSPESQQRWAIVREELSGAAMDAADHVLWCLGRAHKAGALGALPDVDTESDLRSDHADHA